MSNPYEKYNPPTKRNEPIFPASTPVFAELKKADELSKSVLRVFDRLAAILDNIDDAPAKAAVRRREATEFLREELVGKLEYQVLEIVYSCFRANQQSLFGDPGDMMNTDGVTAFEAYDPERLKAQANQINPREYERGQRALELLKQLEHHSDEWGDRCLICDGRASFDESEVATVRHKPDCELANLIAPSTWEVVGGVTFWTMYNCPGRVVKWGSLK